jgi:hypothetical protein
MRTLILAGLMVFALAAPARADSGLAGAVGATWLARTADASLHAIAHERVLEISACGDCMTHDLMRPGTAEVLGFNAGFPNPVARIVSAWKASAVHNAILSDSTFGRIGCAERVVGADHWFACVLGAGWGSGGAPGGQTTVTLPDTAMP